MIITFTKLTKDAVIPKRHSDGAAGYDICTVEEVEIPSKSIVKLRTGLFLDLKEGICPLLLSRSGLSIKNGLEVLPVQIKDREEIKITIINHHQNTFYAKRYMRIAQLVFFKEAKVKIEEVK